MDLRERKPGLSTCTLAYDAENSKYDFKGPNEEAYIADGDTPKIRLTKAKDANNRQLPKLQKRLATLNENMGFCTITLQRDFCGIVERCHGLERSQSWIDPALMTRLDYWLGFDKPGRLNLDTRRNIWEGAVNIHRLADNGGLAFLLLLKPLESVLEYAQETEAITNIDERRFYEDVLESLYQSPTSKTFPYDIAPILIDECYPIVRKPAQSVTDNTDTTEVSIHVYPYSTIGVIDLHLSPPFAIVDFWMKIGKYGQRVDWTDDQKKRAQLVMEIMEIWQKVPPPQFLARKPPAPTPKGVNGGRDIVMDYSTPSRQAKVTSIPQLILVNGHASEAPGARPSHAPAASDDFADLPAQPSSSGASQPALTALTSRSEKSKGKQKAVYLEDSHGDDSEAMNALSPVLEEDEDTAPNGNNAEDSTATVTLSPPEEGEEDAAQPPIPTTSAPSAPKKAQRDKKRPVQDVDDDEVDKPKPKRTKKNVDASQASSAPVYWTRSRKAAEDKAEEVKPKKGRKKARKKNW